MAMKAEQAPGARPNPAFGNGKDPATGLLTPPGAKPEILAAAARHCSPLQAALSS